MGANYWDYFVPYQPDIEQALQDLRTSLFAQGKYRLIDPSWKDCTFEEWLGSGCAITDSLNAEERVAYEAEFLRCQTLPEPRTIEELLAWNGPEGTGSILDIGCVSASPDWFTISPLTEEQMLDLFGTTQPTHAMIGAAEGRYFDLRGSAAGLYIVIYQDGIPAELFFAGCSGD